MERVALSLPMKGRKSSTELLPPNHARQGKRCIKIFEMFYHLDLDCSSLDIFLVAVHFLLSSRSSTKLLPPSLVVIVEWEGRVLELPCPYRC
jgi:hypothetical protein